MRHTIAAAIFFLLALPLRAQTGIPENSFWYEPKTFAPGETISFTALLYNSEATETTFVVALRHNGKKIEEKKAIIPPHDARAVSFAWKAEAGEHTFEAAIASAQNRGTMLILNQELGKARIAIGKAPAGRVEELTDVVKEKSDSILARIDSWRMKKLAEYKVRKAELKEKIDNTETAEQLDALAEPDRLVEGTIESKPFLPAPNSALIYLEYFYYIVLSFIFSSALFFYIAGGFLAFLVLRFFYVRIV